MRLDDAGKRMVVLFATIFIVGVGFSIIMPVLPYYAESLGASAFQLGMLLTVYAIAQFIFAPIWGVCSDRFGRRPVLLLGLLGYSVTYILFAFATHLWMLYVIRIAGGAMGLIGAAMGMGMVFGPAIGGVLSSISLAFPFVLAGLGDRTDAGRFYAGSGSEFWILHRHDCLRAGSADAGCGPSDATSVAGVKLA